MVDREIVFSFKQDIEYYERHLSIAEEVGDRAWEGEKCCNLGNAYASLGSFKQAIEYHERSLSIAKEVGDRAGEGVAYGNLGNANASLGNFKQAIEYHEQSLSISKEIGDRAWEAKAYCNLGNAYASLGNFKQAIEYHEQSLSIAKEVGNRAWEGKAYCNLGDAFAGLGNFKQAIEYHEQSLSIAKKLGNRAWEGKAYRKLGDAYANLGIFKQAIEYHERSLSIAKEVRDRAWEGKAYCNLGDAYANLGDFTQAIKNHERSLSIAKEVGDRAWEGKAYRNLGDANASLGNFKQAIEYHERSLSIAKQEGERAGQGNACYNQGNAYAIVGNFKQATEYHKRNLSIATEEGDGAGEEKAYRNLASLGNLRLLTMMYQEEVGDEAKKEMSKELYKVFHGGSLETLKGEEGKTEEDFKEKTINKDPSPQGLFSSEKMTKPETGESQLPREVRERAYNTGRRTVLWGQREAKEERDKIIAKQRRQALQEAQQRARCEDESERRRLDEEKGRREETEKKIKEDKEFHELQNALISYDFKERPRIKKERLRRRGVRDRIALIELTGSGKTSFVGEEGKTEKELKGKTVNKDPSPQGLFSSEMTKPETGESQLPKESSSEEATQSKRWTNKSEGVLPTKTNKNAPLWTKTISVSSVITSEGGRVVGEGFKLVCPPGAVERPVTVTVTLEDPSKYCGLLVQNDLENDVMFCAPIINLQPNGHHFKRGVELTVRLKGAISSFDEVVILHGKETCPGKIAWEDITHNTIESNETSDEVLITTEEFSIIATLIKRVLIFIKDIASRLNFVGFNHSLLVLFNDKSVPNQLAVVFVSEDVENETFFQEDETSVLVQLKEEGFREIHMPSVKGQDVRRIYNQETLKVSLSFGEDYKCSSSDLTIVVKSSTWWSTGHAIKLPLESTEVKQDKILCGRITVKGKYGNNKERHFCELDIHSYIRGSLGVKGDIFNVIPIAEALKVSKEVLHEIKENWRDDECQLKVLLEQTDFSSLKEVLEDLKPDYRLTTKRGQMHVKHIRYFATKIGGLEHESVELEKHFASKIHELCQTVLRDCCLEMESTADGVGKAASSTKLGAFITIRMQGRIPDCLKDFLFFTCKDICSSSEECIIEKFKSIVPELIQMIKEVFVDNEADYEEQNGLRGLSDETLAPFELSIRIAQQDKTVLTLMSVVGKIMEKLCQQNCSYGRESEIERWGKSAANLAMLDFLKSFFQNCPENRRLHKRLELFSERTMDILSNPREFADEIFIRDFANVALSLIDFAKFDASKLVRFLLIDSSNSRINCSRENTQYDLNRHTSVFSQIVHVKKESEDELKLHASASVHMGGQIHKIGAFQSVIMLHESGWESFEKCRSPFHNVTTAKVKDKDSDNLQVVLCSSQKQELSEMLRVLESEMSEELVDLTKSQVTQCPLTARNISAKAGKVLSLRLIYKWGSDSLDFESNDFVVCADSSAQSASFPQLQLFGVSTAPQLDEAAATQGNPFPLASGDVNFNFPVTQPFNQRPLNIQCQKVEYHLHHHNNMMQGHVCVVGDRTSLNNPMPAQGAIEEAQGNFSRLSLTDEK